MQFCKQSLTKFLAGLPVQEFLIAATAPERADCGGEFFSEPNKPRATRPGDQITKVDQDPPGVFMAIAKTVTQNTTHQPRLRGKTKTVELVLGGGGVKGFAHVGFLKAVQELRIRYGMITGVSIGTLIAVLFVNGFSTSEIENIFAEELQVLNRKKLTRSMLLPAALDRLIFGNGSASLLALMTDLVARYNLKPKHNLHLVAYNPLTRQPVIFTGTNYDLARAMAASCAIPFVFQPIENGEETSLLTWLPRFLPWAASSGETTIYLLTVDSFIRPRLTFVRVRLLSPNSASPPRGPAKI